MAWLDIAQFYFATGHCSGYQIGSSLDPIWYYFVVTTTKCLNPFYNNLITPGSTNLGTHGDQAFSEIDYFWFARCVLDYSCAFSQGCRHHYILGTGYGNHVHKDSRTLESTGAGLDVAFLDRNISAHGRQAFYMQIDRPRTNGTAAGHGNFGFAKTC